MKKYFDFSKILDAFITSNWDAEITNVTASVVSKNFIKLTVASIFFKWTITTTSNMFFCSGIIDVIKSNVCSV